MGIRKYIVTLTSEERRRLTQLVSCGQDKAYRIKHANILLAVDERGPHLPSWEIARLFSCHFNTVTEICQRFVEQGLEASLNRKKRETPPTPRKLDGRGEAQLIALACRKPPEGASRWALRLLADELVELGVVESISHETVRQVLKKRSSAAPADLLGDSSKTECRLRGRHGRRPGPLRKTERRELPRGVHG